MTERLPPTDLPDDEEPLSLEELARAESLERLGLALREAYAATPLSAARHERLLSRALEDPLAPPAAAELEGAQRLRRALAGDAELAESSDEALLQALKHAHAPEPLGELANARIIRSTVFAARSRTLTAIGGSGLLFAAAAALLLWLGPANSPAPEVSPTFLASRSLAPLLGQEASVLTPSERMDRIAQARAQDLRENRYRAWGVR